MKDMTRDFIRSNIAASMPVFKRGINLYENGSYICDTADFENGVFVYEVDGNYGDYTINIKMLDDVLGYECDCPFPGRGCKHVVASLLDVADRYGEWKTGPKPALKQTTDAKTDADAADFLLSEEIRALAIEDRKKRAVNEKFILTPGDMCKGEHLVETPVGRQYMVTLHDPAAGLGHCSCPDFATNRLGTCKHILFVSDYLKKQPGFNKQIAGERFPFIDVFWDSTWDLPAFFCERLESEPDELIAIMGRYFDPDGYFIKDKIGRFSEFLSAVSENKRVRIQENVIHRIDEMEDAAGLASLADVPIPTLTFLKTKLYPYQMEGVRFALFKKGALIGDEMGLGKTLQAIAAAILKKQMFGFEKVVIVTLASLKEQWKREIEKFTDEKGVIIAGNPAQRAALYESDEFFKITNYEAVLRDVLVLSRFKPDLVILDEAQRIKNFNTKTADAVKQIPKKHAMVLTGTPLENKLEDVYSIVQFLDPYRLSPLWKFAADHFLISRHKKGRVVGYKNLGRLAEKLSPIVIRRKKEEVLSELPDEVVNNYFIDLSEKQAKMHLGYLQSLGPLLSKKYLTPMDLRKIQTLLLCMRRTCDSTYLIDRRTNISPKLAELEGIVDELVRQNNRKVVIFSEWTTMTFLIAKQLSNAGIYFVELTGKVPVKKRQALIDEFTNNPECNVFLSTDAGGTGLNLQAADCVINFELPWNPARMNQRIGRVNRIGQKSRCVNVVNLIAKNSIEERILAGIQMKTDLFNGVFDNGADRVEFSKEKKTELLNRLRAMMDEEPEPVVPEPRPQEEIPEDTPYFLNPKALEEEDAGEEGTEDEDTEDEATMDAGVDELVGEARDETVPDMEAGEPALPETAGAGVSAAPVSGQSPEKMEEVLNSGMQFLSGLMEMATGSKMAAAGDSPKMISIDKQTGEVTMKFKLPGF